MTNKIAAKFTVAHHALNQRMSDQERGASALEYVGMIVVAALLVVAIVTGIDTDAVKESVGEQVDKILNPKDGS